MFAAAPVEGVRDPHAKVRELWRRPLHYFDRLPEKKGADRKSPEPILGSSEEESGGARSIEEERAH